MKDETNILPGEEDATKIVQRALKESVISVKRFTTGACHFVYDVISQSGRDVVARIAWPKNRHFLAGAVYWNQRLKSKGVPLPAIINYDLDATVFPFPYMLLERLAGDDLGAVYPQLSGAEKRVLANEIARVQNIAGSLPPGKGFGYVDSYESDSFYPTWTNVLYGSLERSRARIEAVGVIDVRQVERVTRKLDGYQSYFSQVLPRLFLDDTTTRNVIVHNGKLSGIVDVDCVCFGDGLLPIALTRMALINMQADLDYINYWCEAVKVTEQQKEVLDLYTALFCVDFMSEIGQRFNKNRPEPIDRETIQRLTDTLEELLRSI